MRISKINLIFYSSYSLLTIVRILFIVFIRMTRLQFIQWPFHRWGICALIQESTRSGWSILAVQLRFIFSISGWILLHSHWDIPFVTFLIVVLMSGKSDGVSRIFKNALVAYGQFNMDNKYEQLAKVFTPPVVFLTIHSEKVALHNY